MYFHAYNKLLWSQNCFRELISASKRSSGAFSFMLSIQKIENDWEVGWIWSHRLIPAFLVVTNILAVVTESSKVSHCLLSIFSFFTLAPFESSPLRKSRFHIDRLIKSDWLVLRHYSMSSQFPISKPSASLVFNWQFIKAETQHLWHKNVSSVSQRIRALSNCTASSHAIDVLPLAKTWPLTDSWLWISLLLLVKRIWCNEQLHKAFERASLSLT